MQQQKCTDSEQACDACNGYGYVVKAADTDMRTMAAMIAAGLGDTPIETFEVECKGCFGTGRKTYRGGSRS